MRQVALSASVVYCADESYSNHTFCKRRQPFKTLARQCTVVQYAATTAAAAATAANRSRDLASHQGGACDLSSYFCALQRPGRESYSRRESAPVQHWQWLHTSTIHAGRIELRSTAHAPQTFAASSAATVQSVKMQCTVVLSCNSSTRIATHDASVLRYAYCAIHFLLCLTHAPLTTAVTSRHSSKQITTYWIT
eukprot:8176-Heterococcus_DN1.PRE.2